ncbi:hypothetical protein [Pseudidiomarina halophila]
MLKQRLITALILLPLALYCVFGLALEWFAAVITVVMIGAAWEWSPIMGLKRP